MEKSNKNSLPPCWEKLRILSLIVATILIPSVIYFVGQSYNKTLRQNEIGARYVEMAINILKAPPKTATHSLRKWAIDVVNHYSEVPISTKALKELEQEDLSHLLKWSVHDSNLRVSPTDGKLLLQPK